MAADRIPSVFEAGKPVRWPVVFMACDESRDNRNPTAMSEGGTQPGTSLTRLKLRFLMSLDSVEFAYLCPFQGPTRRVRYVRVSLACGVELCVSFIAVPAGSHRLEGCWLAASANWRGGLCVPPRRALSIGFQLRTPSDFFQLAPGVSTERK